MRDLTRIICIIPAVLFLLSACPTGTEDPNMENQYLEDIPVTPKNLLYLETVDAHYDGFSGYDPTVFMSFSKPSELGAQLYTLEYSADDGLNWQTWQHNGQDLSISDGENFSLRLSCHCRFRLRISGGVYDGETSNTIDVPTSDVETYFRTWSRTEMGDITHAPPDAGFLLQTSCTVLSCADGSDRTEGLTFQWYRLDPRELETCLPVEGATEPEYRTTFEDIGYRMMLKVTGDESNNGGILHIYSDYVVR